MFANCIGSAVCKHPRRVMAFLILAVNYLGLESYLIEPPYVT